MEIGQEYTPHKKFQSFLIPKWLAKRNEISPGTKICFAVLTYFAGENGKCFPSHNELAKSIGVSKRQISYYLEELRNEKLIEIKINEKGNNNFYHFLWHEWIDEENTKVNSKVNSKKEKAKVYKKYSKKLQDGLQEIANEENAIKRILLRSNIEPIFFKNRRTRKVKRNKKIKSMGEKTREKASNKTPNKKSNNNKYEISPNIQLLEHWNKQPNLRTHQIKSASKTYKRSLQKIHELRNGTLTKKIEKDMLQNGIPYEWLSAKWSKAEICTAIRNLNKWGMEGFYPVRKEWIGNLSLDEAIFNPRTGTSPLLQAYQKGAIPLYNPYEKLVENEKNIYDRFEKFFSERGKTNINTKKQIVELVKNLRSQRENNHSNWALQQPENFGCVTTPSSIMDLTRDYLEFLRGELVPDFDFIPRKDLTPRGLKVGGYVWSKFEKAFHLKFCADPIEGPVNY